MTVRLCVYGLLRRGEPMHHVLGGARHLGDVRLPGFELHDLGDYPAALTGEGSVAAEVYELPSPAVLQVLDEAEGIHRKPPLYTRELVEALDAPAWLYVWAGPVPDGRRIASGDWRNR